MLGRMYMFGEDLKSEKLIDLLDSVCTWLDMRCIVSVGAFNFVRI